VLSRMIVRPLLQPVSRNAGTATQALGELVQLVRVQPWLVNVERWTPVSLSASGRDQQQEEQRGASTHTPRMIGSPSNGGNPRLGQRSELSLDVLAFRPTDSRPDIVQSGRRVFEPTFRCRERTGRFGKN
jgi:hypothetical protein